MKIAAGTLDKLMVNPDHFGSSRYFLIAEIKDKTVTQTEFRENPYNGHGIAGKGMKIAGLLSDCQGILIRSIGNHAFNHMPARGLEIYLTREADFDKAFALFTEEKLKKFDRTAGKFRPMQGAHETE